MATPANDNPMEFLSGTVERVTFHSEETGFCVLRVKARGHRDLVTVVGTAATIAPGEFVSGEGWWVTDRTYGLQFKTATLQVVPPTSLEGMAKYLGSGMVKGIGPHFANKLVGAFGEQVFDVIETAPERLIELEGIGPVRQQRVVAAWAEQKVIRNIMVFLHTHGVGTARHTRQDKRGAPLITHGIRPLSVGPPLGFPPRDRARRSPRVAVVVISDGVAVQPTPSSRPPRPPFSRITRR